MLSYQWPGQALIVGLLFCISANAALLSSRIEITGISGQLESNVRAHLSLSEEECDAPQWRIKQRFQRADSEISEGLKALGYYQPTITKTLTIGDDCWETQFDIDRGRSTRIQDIEIEIKGDAENDPEFIKLIAEVPLKSGERLRHDHYDGFKTALANLALQRGYLDARFEISNIRVKPEKRLADIELTFNSGKRYRFGKIEIEKQAYDQGLVRRMVTLEEGALYEADLITDQYQAFNGTDFFQIVLIQPQIEDRKDGIVPINIRLQPKKRHSYSAGIGVSTDTGPRLSIGYENRRVTSSGHRFRTELSASPVISEFTTGYQIPLEKALTDSLGVDAAVLREDTDTAQSESLILGLRHNLARAHDWKETRYLELRKENFRIGDQDDSARLIIPGNRWSRVTADNLIYPKRGLSLRGEIRGASEQFGSDATFAQVSGRVKSIASLPARLRLITRGEAGFTLQNGFQDLPASVRFFTGGDSSVRGYDFRSLGPQDSEGDVIGGQHLLVGSVELERELPKDFGIAAFYDAGNAVNDFSDPLFHSVGIGLRWRSPLGPLGVDFAHPLDDPDQIVRLHLRFGSDL